MAADEEARAGQASDPSFSKKEVSEHLDKVRAGDIGRKFQAWEEFPAVVVNRRDPWNDDTHSYAYQSVVKTPDEVNLEELDPHAGNWFATFLKKAGKEVPEGVLEKADEYETNKKQDAKVERRFYRTGRYSYEATYAPWLTKDANVGAVRLCRLRKLYQHGMETGFVDEGGVLAKALVPKGEEVVRRGGPGKRGTGAQKKPAGPSKTEDNGVEDGVDWIWTPDAAKVIGSGPDGIGVAGTREELRKSAVAWREAMAKYTNEYARYVWKGKPDYMQDGMEALEREVARAGRAMKRLVVVSKNMVKWNGMEAEDLGAEVSRLGWVLEEKRAALGSLQQAVIDRDQPTPSRRELRRARLAVDEAQEDKEAAELILKDTVEKIEAQLKEAEAKCEEVRRKREALQVGTQGGGEETPDGGAMTRGNVVTEDRHRGMHGGVGPRSQLFPNSGESDAAVSSSPEFRWPSSDDDDGDDGPGGGAGGAKAGAKTGAAGEATAGRTEEGKTGEATEPAKSTGGEGVAKKPVCGQDRGPQRGKGCLAYDLESVGRRQPGEFPEGSIVAWDLGPPGADEEKWLDGWVEDVPTDDPLLGETKDAEETDAGEEVEEEGDEQDRVEDSLADGSTSEVDASEEEASLEEPPEQQNGGRKRTWTEALGNAFTSIVKIPGWNN